MLNSIKNTPLKVLIIVVSVILILGIITSIVMVSLYCYKEKDIDIRVMGYYTGNLTNEQLDKLPLDKYTHILYAFALSNQETGDVYLTEEKEQALIAFMEYKRAHNLPCKVLLSIGGGGYPWPMASCKDDAARKNFGESCVEALEKYGLDGIDLDWEFPQTDFEIDCFNKLLVQIRESIGKNKLLSIAATSNLAQVGKYDNKTLRNTLDFINVMTYDFDLNKQAPYNTVKAVMFNFYCKGYKKSQLNLGVPFYARSASSAYEYNGYNSIREKINSGELTLKETSNYSYAYSEKGRASFDTPNIIKKKAKFVKNCGYGGIFTWHISCDYNNELFDAMYTVKD